MAGFYISSISKRRKLGLRKRRYLPWGTPRVRGLSKCSRTVPSLHTRRNPSKSNIDKDSRVALPLPSSAPVPALPDSLTYTSSPQFPPLMYQEMLESLISTVQPIKCTLFTPLNQPGKDGGQAEVCPPHHVGLWKV